MDKGLCWIGYEWVLLIHSQSLQVLAAYVSELTVASYAKATAILSNSDAKLLIA